MPRSVLELLAQTMGVTGAALALVCGVAALRGMVRRNMRPYWDRDEWIVLFALLAGVQAVGSLLAFLFEGAGPGDVARMGVLAVQLPVWGGAMRALTINDGKPSLFDLPNRALRASDEGPGSGHARYRLGLLGLAVFGCLLVLQSVVSGSAASVAWWVQGASVVAFSGLGLRRLRELTRTMTPTVGRSASRSVLGMWAVAGVGLFAIASHYA
ncbi:MAG TPA: hypothetical protein VFZ65_03280 [Planctomycetota bacterium]|nr:hypothetical protein [Planctomycetota bacterium]